jgi:hypothetical protein
MFHQSGTCGNPIQCVGGLRMLGWDFWPRYMYFTLNNTAAFRHVLLFLKIDDEVATFTMGLNMKECLFSPICGRSREEFLLMMWILTQSIALLWSSIFILLFVEVFMTPSCFLQLVYSSVQNLRCLWANVNSRLHRSAKSVIPQSISSSQKLYGTEDV